MQYRNTFINYYLQIKVSTNSRCISKLIKNVLDFDNIQHAKPKIKVSFYLNEVKLKGSDESRNFLYQSWPNKNRHLLSFFGKRIADIKTDPKTGIVKGSIFNYQESQKEPILDFILMQPLHFILAYQGLFFLHTSVVCKDKNCILIIGPQDSGKSTLAFILSQNGFNLLADDDCYVKLAGKQIKLFPFPTKMGLNEKILKRYPKFNQYALKNYLYGGKSRITTNFLSTPKNYSGLRPKIIIFPKYKRMKNIYMQQLSKQEALSSLLKNTFLIYPQKLYPEISLKRFATLRSLIKQTNSFEVIYNDEKLEKAAEIICSRFEF